METGAPRPERERASPDRKSNRGVLAGPAAALALLVIAGVAVWTLFEIYLPHVLGMELGMDPRRVSAVMAGSYVLLFLMGPVFGHASDRFRQAFGSRAPFIAGAALFSAALLLLLPVVSSRGGESAGYRSAYYARGDFLLLVFGWGIATAAYRAPAFALLARYARISIEADHRARVAGFLAAGTGLVAALGTLLGGLDSADYQVACVAAAGLLGLAAVSLWRADRRLEAVVGRLAPGPRGVERSRPAVFLLYLVVALGAGFAFRAVTLGFLAHDSGWSSPAWATGLVWAAVAAAGIPGGYLAGKLGPARTATTGLVFCTLASLLVFTGGGTLPGTALAVLQGAGWALFLASALPLVLANIPSRRFGLCVALFASMDFGAAGAWYFLNMRHGPWLDSDPLFRALPAAGFLISALLGALAGRIFRKGGGS